MKAKPKKIAIMASGRGSNMDAIIDAAKVGRINAEVSAVISDKKGAAALSKASDAGIPAYFVSRARAADRDAFERDLLEILERHSVDLICCAGFMRVLSAGFVNRYKGRIMNIHPALLPAFPGLFAQQQALDYGVKVSGCTVHFADAGTDTGPIICQRAVDVLETDTAESLAERIIQKEHEAYVEAVRLFCEDRLSIVGRRVVIV